MLTRAHLFTDADNTLWDTDAVFATAQLQMLREIERITGRNAPDDEDRGLAFLRNVDQRIAASHPDHLQYPPRLLAYGLDQVLQGVVVEEVVAQITDRNFETTGRFEQLQTRFLDSLKRLPQLREGVREGVRAISSARIPITVVTEARLERCRKFLADHQLDSMITEVVSLRKTTDAYLALKVKAQCNRCFMIGDQPDRDIQAASAAGFATFYFPGSFTPYWVRDLDSLNTRQISRYDAIVPEILAE